MDAEPTLSGLSEVVYCAIPDRGATWGDLVREVRPPSNEAMEFALKGLRGAGLVQLLTIGDTGVWTRRGTTRPVLHLEPLAKRRARTAKARLARQQDNPMRYNKQGERYCSRGKHFLPVTEFNRGSCRDGLHVWCIGCRRQSRTELTQRIIEARRQRIAAR